MGSTTHQQKWAWGGAKKSGGAKNSSHARAVYNHDNYPVSGISTKPPDSTCNIIITKRREGREAKSQ